MSLSRLNARTTVHLVIHRLGNAYQRTWLSTSNANFRDIWERNSVIRVPEMNTVFYNEAQVYNRDLSVLVLQYYSKIRELEKQANYQLKLKRYHEAVEAEAAGVTSNNGNKKPMLPREPLSGISIVEPLAASGIRSIRYLNEVPGIRSIWLNDYDPNAIATARNNFELNNINCDNDEKVKFTSLDAVDMLNRCRERNNQVDVVDLDPYGTCAPFLDSAVQALASGGLLCLTSTDMRALAGKVSSTCFSQYGSMPLHDVPYVHEMALRIILNAVESTAARYHKHIEPWVSISTDYYVRLFIRIVQDKEEVMTSASKKMLVYQATSCSSFYWQTVGKVPASIGRTFRNSNLESSYDSPRARSTPPADAAPANAGGIPSNQDPGPSTAKPLVQKQVSMHAPIHAMPTVCPVSNSALKMGGPFWARQLHDRDVVNELLAILRRERVVHTPKLKRNNQMKEFPNQVKMESLLEAIMAELPDAPFYYTTPDLFSDLGIPLPTKHMLESALMNAGYDVSGFHRDPGAIKTNAPNTVVWDAVKAIVRYEMRKQNKQLGSPPFGASNRNTDASAPSSDRLGLGAKSARDIILATPPKNSYQFERRKHQEDFGHKAPFAHLRNPDSFGPKKRASTK